MTSQPKPSCEEVSALIERLRVIENKPREPDACHNLYPPDYIVECRAGLREAVAALANLPASEQWRHVKTGGVYTIVADNALIESCLDRVTIYQGEDGRMWLSKVS